MRAIVLVLAIAACNRIDADPSSVPLAVRPPVARPVRGEAATLIAKFECNRCHEVPEVAPPPRDKQCFGCHQQIHGGTFVASDATLDKWRRRITSLRDAPSLANADRLRRDWLKSYLLRPYDVRPGSVAQMPRLAISHAEADVIAKFLVPADHGNPIGTEASQVVRGEHLYRTLACARCHRFTGASVDDATAHAAGKHQVAPLDVAWRLAPDLRGARDRVQPEQLVAWIGEPRGAMPKLGIQPDDARALAAFILATPLGALPASDLPMPAIQQAGGVRTSPGANVYAAVRKRVPVLDRDVVWAEVEKAVFRDTCWHCHAVPDLARGDGGPGNSGGFGFQPRGLDLSSYSGVSEGSLDDRGERRSVFGPIDGAATPRLVVQLLARHVEQAGYEVPGVTGMPLGLPALPYDKIRLVATWIAQGRPN